MMARPGKPTGSWSSTAHERVPFLSLAAAGAAALATPAPGIAADDAAPHPVIELRQYKIVPGSATR